MPWIVPPPASHVCSKSDISPKGREASASFDIRETAPALGKVWKQPGRCPAWRRPGIFSNMV